jgi:hypothetical protein
LRIARGDRVDEVKRQITSDEVPGLKLMGDDFNH